MEYALLKLAALVIFFTFILPVLKFYIQAKVKEQKKIQRNKPICFTELKALKEIYEKERKPYYLEARAIFNSLCKQGKMHHEDIVLFRKLLEDSVGSYIQEYKGYKFENEYNRIYVYLKNWHIDVSQWEQIINYLNEIYESEKAIEQN